MGIKEGDIVQMKKDNSKYGVVHQINKPDVYVILIPAAVGKFLKNNKDFHITINKKISNIDSSVKKLKKNTLKKNRTGGRKKKIIKLKVSDIKKI